jgi:Big-like domain-containing protein
MSKLYRSLLWSGLVAAGVAACGDDVTVTPTPPPTPGVHSISVGPTATIFVGQTLQMTASVNADPGVATTVTWRSTNTAVATVGQTTGLVTAVAAGTVAIEACSTVNTAVCANATVTVSSGTPATVQQVNVTPGNAFLVKPATGSTSLQLSAAVIGTGSPSQTVTWSLPGSPANASISATGLLTITSAIAGGTINVSACSTVVGFTNVCGFSAVTIQVPTPASVSISAITWVPAAGAPGNCAPTGPNSVPVTLTNVSCQIEVTANVNAGDVVLQRIDVIMGGQVVASQTFPGTVAADENASVSAPVSITLSVNTRQVKSGTTAGGSCNGFVCIPVVFNGNQNVSLNLYTSGSAAPLASNATPVVMNNADAVIYPKTLVSTVLTPTFTNGGVVFFKGTQTLSGGEYIAFSKQVPLTSSFTGTLCGASSTVVTGTATTGILLGGVFTCAGVEGTNTVSTAVVPAFTFAAAIGPDGTPITPPAFFSTVGTGFTVPINAAGTTELRWNLLLQNGAPVPLPVALTAVGVDNKAPVVTIGNVAFNDLFDQPWVNATYLFSQDVGATDAGSGLAAGMPQAHDYANGVFVPASAGCTATVKTSPGPLSPVAADGYPETLTSDGSPEGFRICAFATDNLGNSASSGPSNFFGVDKVAPSSRLAGSTAATPTFASLLITFPAVSSTANTTIFSIAAPFAATDRWGLEAQDTRSGFNQNAVAGFPANETMTRLAPSVNPAAVIPCGFTSPLGVVLSDNWVRSSHIPAAAILDCGLGAPNTGYFTFNGVVTDRAGNVAPTITRNYAIDQYAAPVLSSIGPGSIFYTAGLPAGFFLFGSDDLEIIDVNLTLAYPGMNAITATLVGVTKPLSAISGCARWDATLCNILAGATATDPYLFGRVDLTCTGAAAPYASCLLADALPPTAANFNNVDTDADAVFENDDKNPTSVSAIAFDVASQASGTVTSGLLTAQTNDVAQQWVGVGADIITWRITSTAGTTVIAEHKASTSITATYFDFVYLARADAGATALVICSQFPQNPVVNPVLTDNGVNRFWTYTATKPTGTAPCATGGSWYAVGVKAGAALVTQGLP